MSIAQSPLSTSAPCLPSILSCEVNTSDDDSPHSNSHSRGGSDDSDQIILPPNGLRLPSPAESNQSHTSFREEELEGEIKRLRKELESKFKENSKLMLDRKDMDNEINELTESLFTEANKMVNEAKRKERNAEKRLEEALLRIECFQEEAQTLKKRIIELEKSCAVSNGINSGKQTPSKKKRLNWLTKSSSTFLKEEKAIESLDSISADQHGIAYYTTQHDIMKSVNFCKLVAEWMESPTLALSSHLIFETNIQDVKPCLSFPNEELSDEIQEAIHANTFMMEKVISKLPTESLENSQCDLTYGTDQPCQYKIKMAEHTDWYYINQTARQRIAIVCEFFQYLRYIKDGLIKPDVDGASFIIQKLRANMTLARLGLTELITTPNNSELQASI
ncbi:Rab-3A-interacting protein-like isoform X6 [Oopsacas minuta]|uniref:Rab-3A-interacting protein-like isoform X6 n=1 Tax=Oopsacas minuta TaxID=111878 RepID=A0AAV7KAR5_9METZ|nr:Rab-3A-interacting protein-like isoform X6 [Oopsacas minuta]